MRKIRFVEVEFRNFLSFGNNWQKFQFSDGLNIIQGMTVETGKSNGAGKSSLTELVPFALFGKTIKKITKAKIINWYNEKQCEVRLHFTVDGVPHEIRRGIKPNKLQVFVDGSELPKLASAVDFQNQIEDEIIGMDFGTFQNLIYFSPNNTISIINAGKPEKRKFLESLFDLSVYSKMGKTANEKLTANDKKVAVLTQENEGFYTHINTLEEFLEGHVIPAVKPYKIRLSGLVIQYDALKEKTFDVDDSILKLIKGSMDNSIKILAKAEKDHEETDRIIEFNQKLLAKVSSTEDLEAKIDELWKQHGDLEYHANLTIDEDTGIVADRLQFKETMKDELKELINEIQTLEKRMAILDNLIGNDEYNIEVAEKMKRASVGVCDSCGQEVTEEILQEQVRVQVLKFKLDKDAHKREILEVIRERDKLNEEKDTLYKKVKDESDGIKELLSDIETAKEARQNQKRLVERIEDLPDVEEIKHERFSYEMVIAKEKHRKSKEITDIHMAEIDVERFTEQYDDLKEIDVARKKNDEDIKGMEWQINEVHETITEYETIISKHVEKNEKTELEIEDTKNRIEDNQKQITSANTLTDYLNYLKVSLKDENVKRFAISTLIPYLNQQTNLYLSESGFPYVVTVDSWLDVTIRGLGVADVTYGQLSGGESKGIDMAVQLACNDIASMMARTSLNLMVLDEVLDTSVDSLGVQALLNIVSVRQKANNDSVYVITHRNEIDEFTFDSVIRIMNEDKFSRVEVE